MEFKSFSLPEVFKNLFALIQDNENDISKLKYEYIKESQEKKQ